MNTMAQRQESNDTDTGILTMWINNEFNMKAQEKYETTRKGCSESLSVENQRITVVL